MGIIFDTSAIIGIERGHESLDALIAATAISLDYTIATVNIRDFEKIPGVKMEKLQ
jgi:predicted nucleic acid-binding protein